MVVFCVAKRSGSVCVAVDSVRSDGVVVKDVVAEPRVVESGDGAVRSNAEHPPKTRVLVVARRALRFTRTCLLANVKSLLTDEVNQSTDEIKEQKALLRALNFDDGHFTSVLHDDLWHSFHFYPIILCAWPCKLVG